MLFYQIFIRLVIVVTLTKDPRTFFRPAVHLVLSVSTAYFLKGYLVWARMTTISEELP